jgi:hypothetical protein
MNADAKDSLLALLGIALLGYGIGMALVTWFRPRSLYEPIFRARWRFGIPASKIGAAALVAVHLTMGSFFLLHAFHSKLATIPAILFIVAAAFSLLARLMDMDSENET